ncbi:ACT domain-containing protein [Sessilibacter sp. MAH1]
MHDHAVMTVLTDDKPGIVEFIANIIERNNGNWTESQLQHLHGKFAGILSITLESNLRAQLESDLQALTAKGIHYQLSWSSPTLPSTGKTAKLSVLGPDRTGIIKEIAQALAQRSINLLNLESRCTSAPWTGEALFEANAEISVPKSTDMEELVNKLSVITDELGLELTLED